MYDIITIYQLKQTAKTRDIRFVSLNAVRKLHKKPVKENYKKVYEIGRTALGLNHVVDHKLLLNQIYNIFNVAHPEDYKGHSLSISDIVMLDGEAFYVDTFGFKRINF